MDSLIKQAEKQFKNAHDEPIETTLDKLPLVVNTVLVEMTTRGYTEVNVLTKVSNKIKVKADGEKEVTYNTQVSFHPPESFVDLRCYGASLVKYYLGAKRHLGHETIFSLLHFDEAEQICDLSPQEVLAEMQIVLDEGKGSKRSLVIAQQIRDTWEFYNEIRDREFENYDAVAEHTDNKNKIHKARG